MAARIPPSVARGRIRSGAEWNVPPQNGVFPPEHNPDPSLERGLAAVLPDVGTRAAVSGGGAGGVACRLRAERGFTPGTAIHSLTEPSEQNWGCVRSEDGVMGIE